MKNRAKCLICGDIIESFHSTDHVICKCGECEVFDGEAMRYAANDFKNFARVDDEGNEITVNYMTVDEGQQLLPSSQPPYEVRIVPSKKSLDYVQGIIESFKRVPEHALQQPITHSDMISVLETLLEAFKAL